MKATTQRIADVLLAAIRYSVEGVKAFLGVHSPSRAMRERGAASVEDSLRESWVSPSEIDRLAPRGFVESIEDGLRRRGGDDKLIFELPSTGSVKGDLQAMDFLLRSRRALQPA
ncbi:hypothetical protein [Curtobacterium sp. MCPF17_031]|uniref:hypothetical protein n=1 Tax=Curtobacterium sp. MCPF17_031 TaxID=2175653 RepID=UPI0011B6C2A0|nr:hypothetical protein [Curtobacterium sp. MCPF17_031]